MQFLWIISVHYFVWYLVMKWMQGWCLSSYAAQQAYGSSVPMTNFSDSNLVALSLYYDQGNEPSKAQDSVPTLAFWLELLEVNMHLGLALSGFIGAELTPFNVTFLYHLAWESVSVCELDADVQFDFSETIVPEWRLSLVFQVCPFSHGISFSGFTNHTLLMLC